MAEEITLVAGLGNPGPAYAGNRHNAGFLVLDELAARAGGGKFRAHRSGAEILEARIDGQRFALAKPRGFMNLSGGPVVAAARFYKVDPERTVVVHDELDLPFGTVRIKRGGGAGGHNGLRSVSKSLGTPDYLRVRFGIGRPPGRMDPADFVLRDFSGTERKELPLLVDTAADAVVALATQGLEAAQNTIHSG